MERLERFYKAWTLFEFEEMHVDTSILLVFHYQQFEQVIATQPAGITAQCFNFGRRKCSIRNDLVLDANNTNLRRYGNVEACRQSKSDLYIRMSLDTQRNTSRSDQNNCGSSASEECQLRIKRKEKKRTEKETKEREHFGPEVGERNILM